MKIVASLAVMCPSVQRRLLQLLLLLRLRLLRLALPLLSRARLLPRVRLPLHLLPLPFKLLRQHRRLKPHVSPLRLPPRKLHRLLLLHPSLRRSLQSFQQRPLPKRRSPRKLNPSPPKGRATMCTR